VAKLESSASAIQGSDALQLAHLGVPAAAAGTLFFRPHAGHWITLDSAIFTPAIATRTART
jgi:hypothetical protein